MRSGTCSLDNAGATEWYQRSCRHGCHARSFNERGNSHVQAPAGHPGSDDSSGGGACCLGGPPPFRGHDHRQNGNERCCHRTIVDGCLDNACVCCCGGGSGRRRRSLDESLEYHRSDAAFGSVECMSHFGSMYARETERRSSSLYTASMANPVYSAHTRASGNQTMLYGWFLMKPKSDDQNADDHNTRCSTMWGVAIGGYRSSGMADADFLQTGQVIQRVERWKLRTSDGLDVGLMGMINIDKSVANGFSPALVQCFMIGFPSAWNYLLQNLNKGALNGSCPGIRSPSCSLTSTKERVDPSNTFQRSGNPVDTILQSSLFTAAAPGAEKKMAALHRTSIATTTSPLHDRVSSDGNSIPQAYQDHEQVDKNTLREDGDACPEADFMAHNPAVHLEEPSLRDCLPSGSEGLDVEDAGCIPENSSHTQIPTETPCHPSGTDGLEFGDANEVVHGLSAAGLEASEGVIHEEDLRGRAEEVLVEDLCGRGVPLAENGRDAAQQVALPPDDIPCTPLLQTRRRLRSDTDIPVSAHVSHNDPVLDPESVERHAETGRFTSETPQLGFDELVTKTATDPASTLQPMETRKRPRSEPPSPVTALPPEEAIVHTFQSSESLVHTSPTVSEEAGTEVDGHVQEEDIIVTKKEELETEVDQSCKRSCKNTVDIRGRRRKKRYKIARNYYQSRKRKAYSKSYHCGKAAVVEIPMDEVQDVTDELHVVKEEIGEEITGPGENGSNNGSRSLQSHALECSVLSEGSQGGQESAHLKNSLQTSNYIVPPPLPSPRVVDKSKVIEAFGLKRSLHGRVLVPPLATWRNQSIKYDADGGIIAISDGFFGSEDEASTGCYNFKPPTNKGAQKMQRRLCKAADKGPRK